MGEGGGDAGRERAATRCIESERHTDRQRNKERALKNGTERQTDTERYLWDASLKKKKKKKKTARLLAKSRVGRHVYI